MGEEKRPEGSAGHKIVEGANFAVYTLVVEAQGEATLAHPDWPDLSLPLGGLWR